MNKILIIFCLLNSNFVMAQNNMGLEDFLQRVQKKNRNFQSAEVSKDAARDRQTSGDLLLTPSLTLKGGYLSDKKLPNAYTADESKATLGSATYAQKLSTGTSLSLSATATEYRNNNIQTAVYASAGNYSQGALGVSLSQSLWKDAFGHGTRLRHLRESQTNWMDNANLDMQQRKVLIDAEILFWDNILFQEQLRAYRQALDRAQKIESWSQRRFSDGINDKSDLLNAQALVAKRKFQVLTAESDLVGIQKKLRDTLELSEQEPIPELQGPMDRARAPQSILSAKGSVIRLDSYVGNLEAQVRKTASDEAVENAKSDLVLSANYNTNSFDSPGTISDSTKSWGYTNTPTTSIYLTWTYLFDDAAKKATYESARKESVAAQLRSERKKLESDTSWNELLRTHNELSRKIESQNLVSRLQTERAKALQTKLSRGRAITTDVVNSEQDASDSELDLIRLKIEQRKLEAQTKNYVVLKESP